MVSDGSAQVMFPLIPDEMKKLDKKLPEIKIYTKISPAERVSIGFPGLSRVISSAA